MSWKRRFAVLFAAIAASAAFATAGTASASGSTALPLDGHGWCC